MSKPLEDIMNLNLNRYGSEFDYNSFRDTFMEEVDEMFEALEDGDIDEFLDGANDCIVVLAGGITKHGYNPHETLLETIKEISSRKQDPKQKERWANDDKLKRLQKWKKFKEQDKKTLYKADYSKCKIEGK